MVLHLICQLCCNCLKYNATHVVKCSPSYNHSTKHIENCSLNIWPSSSLLVITMDATLHVLKKKIKLNPRKSFTEFISLLLSVMVQYWLQTHKLQIPVVNKQCTKNRYMLKHFKKWTLRLNSLIKICHLMGYSYEKC